LLSVLKSAPERKAERGGFRARDSKRHIELSRSRQFSATQRLCGIKQRMTVAEADEKARIGYGEEIYTRYLEVDERRFGAIL